MANGHGGARPGAGRKPRAERYETEIETAEGRWASLLPSVQKTLEQLAAGGLKKVVKKRMPAVLVTTKEVQIDGLGNPKSLDVPAYPHLEPDKMVVVEEITETLTPDRAANLYIIDRILGKPTQAVEMSGPDGGDIPLPAHDLSRLTTDELRTMRGMLQKTTQNEDQNPKDHATPDETTPPSAASVGGGSGAGAS